MGQCPGGGRMAVRRELAGLTGPQEEHTNSPLAMGPTSQSTVSYLGSSSSVTSEDV